MQVCCGLGICPQCYSSHIKKGKITLYVTDSLWRVTLVPSGRGVRKISLVSVCLLHFEPYEYITFSKQELKLKM